MTKKRFALLAAAVLALASSFSAFAAEGGNTQSAGNDLSDRASLQRGAQLFFNNCAGCHSLKYMRYSRIGEDLGLTPEQVQDGLNLTGVSIGSVHEASFSADQGKKFFGKMPPDLSVISRVRGSDWIYTYLKSFYLDDTRPLGWNNKLFPNASMPNPLWQMQGLQHGVLGEKDAQGDRHVESLALATPGTQTDAQFNQTARDITNFLEYVGEPAALKRQGMGVWVLLFLAGLTFLAYLLKQEYWTDVH